MHRFLKLTLPLLLLVFVWSVQAACLHAADEVQVLRDVSYKPDAASEYERERCKLDLYLPPAKESDKYVPFATIVWFHGGALQAGDKSSGAAIARRFASDNVAVASVNYRLSPQAKFPAYVEDAAAAFAFVRETISKHGGDPRRVFISGHSAGGYLTAMLGVDEQYVAKHGLKLSDIAGLMPIAGQMITHSTIRKERGLPEDRPLIDAAAPAFHAHADRPAFLCIAGSNDMPARAEENRYFVAAMKAVGHKDVTYLEVEGRDHGSVANLIPEADDVVAKAMLEFVARARRQK